MKNKFLFFCVVFWCLPISYLQAQQRDFYGNLVPKEVCSQAKQFKTPQEAMDCLDRICDAADIVNNYNIVPCSQVNNCVATTYNGDYYIVYDNDFMQKVRPFGFTSKTMLTENSDWEDMAILAHELGHLVLNHLSRSVRQRYSDIQLELQADEFAGMVLYKLGACQLAWAQRVMYSSVIPEQATNDHPGRQKRLEAIKKGWEKGKAKYGNVCGTTTTTNENEILSKAIQHYNNKDYVAAKDLFLKIRGNAEAQNYIGEIYYNENGWPRQNYFEDCKMVPQIG